MNDEDHGTVRRLDWPEICPWLILFRSFRLAIRFRALVLSAVAVMAMVTGWMLLALVFQGASDGLADAIQRYRGCPWLVPMEWVPEWPVGQDAAAEAEGEAKMAQTFDVAPTDAAVSALQEMAHNRNAVEPLTGSFEHLSRPLRNFFGWNVSLSKALFLALSGLWAIVVWALFGGAITRSAAVELAAGERIGWGENLRFARSKWLSYTWAPLLPLAGVFICSIFVFAVGWLLRWPATVWIAGLAWPFLLVFGFLMALILLGLVFGWPLMWATISAEGTDSFDAISRSYAYVYQRPLHYLFYGLVAALLGVLGWLLVSNVAAAVIYLTYWSASWVAGAQRVAEIAQGGGNSPMDLVGAGLVGFWVGCVKLLAAGFLFGYFWVAMTAIYFLLRRDVDATEMDEVFTEDDGDGTYGLPTITQDETGAPVVSDEPPEGPSETSPGKEEWSATSEEIAREDQAAGGQQQEESP